MIETFTEFDPAEYLSTSETIAEFMSDALETGDASYVAKAMGTVARAKGMTEPRRDTGVPRTEKGDRFIFRLSAAPALAALLAHQQSARPHLRNGLYPSIDLAAKRRGSIEAAQSEWPGAQTPHTEAAAPLRYHPRPRSTDQHLTSPHQPHHLPGFDSLTMHSLRHRRPCERA